MICKGPSPETLHTQLVAAMQRQAWAAAPPGLVEELLPAPQLPAEAGGAEPGRVAARPPGEREQSAAGAGGAAAFQPDWAMVQGLCAIGYPRLHATNAVAATRNAGVQQAVEWLLDHESYPALDQPSPYLAECGGDGSGGGGGGGVAMQPSGSSGPLAYGMHGLSTPVAAAAAAGAAGQLGGTSFSNPLLSTGSSGSSASGSGPLPSLTAYQRQTSASGVGVQGILKREQQKAAATEK